ncbi:MAG: CRTAC1 family protein [Gemmatimonadota bacterium]
MPRLPAFVSTPVLVIIIAGVPACDRGGTPARDTGARMADTLAKDFAAAIADPSRNPFLNRERIAALQLLPSALDGQEALQRRFLLAQEQVLAGQSEDAIAGLESLIRSAGPSLDLRAPQNKPFYDLLGIAYLRDGEQKNCLNNPAASRCILPLKGEAQHIQQDGARKAIALYSSLLKVFPDDGGTRWLLNIAFMAIGGYPDSVPAHWRIPNITRERDHAFPRFLNIADRVGLAINGLSGGLSVEDFNRDGLLDLFMTSFGLNDAPHLFIADGKGGFADRSASSGLTGIVGGLNNIHADYDNDGFDDIFVMRGAWLGDAALQPNSLLHNRGDGTFDDVTYKAGLASRHPTHSAAWADFNLDGLLDLFVGHESGAANGGSPHMSELFVNNGDGTFREVAHRVGIDVDAFVKGVAWGDVNNDGLPDLFISVLGDANRLLMNRGGTSVATWRFEDAPFAGGASLPIMSFPTWFWDVDQDGWEDLLVLSYDIRNSGSLHEAVAMEFLGGQHKQAAHGAPLPPVESSRLYLNNRDGTYADVTNRFGLTDKVIFAMGANFGDLDNDGWLDFYVGTGNPDLRSVIPNRMFRSVAGRRFEEVTNEGGFGHLQKGHATAFVDLDRDGDEDIYMVMGGAYQGDVFSSVLFENPGWPKRNWIALEMEGRAANRSAIGARVELDVIEGNGSRRTLRRTVGTGGSFGSGSLAVHVGLDDATSVRQLRITWPDAARSVSRFENLEVRKTYRIVQGKSPEVLDRPAVPFLASTTPKPMRH